MKVDIDRARKDSCHVSEMKVGDIGIIQDFCLSCHVGQTVLRIYDGIVILENALATWEDENLSRLDMQVEILPPGTKVTLEIE
jgi:hypothetical protein